MRRELLLMASVIVLTGCDGGSRWTAIRENREGVKALSADNPTAASESFIRALAAMPFESSLHLNLGLAFDRLKRPDEAAGSHANADRLAADEGDRFAARFNMGEILGRSGKVDEALAWYQKALEIDPTSREVKTNIELLMNQQGQGQQQQQQQGQGGDGSQDQKQDQNKDENDDDQQEQKNKSYEKNQKYKPRPYEGELSEADVKKILGEIRQQEQRIRAEFNRREGKERPRDKDW